MPLSRPIPEDVERLIIAFLPNSIPPAPSAPPRSAVRNQGLTVAMRVCKRWKPMAESYLYTHIGCDNIPSLFTQLTSPASGSSARFEHTKSLWLEYREKGAEPSYMSLLGGDGGPAGDGWDGIGGSTAETSKRRMRECEKEVTEHHAAIELFSDIWQDTALPNLQSLAIATGANSVGRTKRSKTFPNEWFWISQKLHIFINTGAYTSLCIRDLYGPLVPQPFTLAESNPVYTTTCHFDTDVPHLPVINGAPTWWIYEGSATQHWGKLIRALGYAIRARVHSRTASQTDGTLSLAVSCSTTQSDAIPTTLEAFHSMYPSLQGVPPPPLPPARPVPLTVDEQRNMSAQLEAALRRANRADFVDCRPGAVPYDFRWTCTEDAPACAACSLA